MPVMKHAATRVVELVDEDDADMVSHETMIYWDSNYQKAKYQVVERE
jgi:hypothetical protein